jgi:hypothetical protein
MGDAQVGARGVRDAGRLGADLVEEGHCALRNTTDSSSAKASANGSPHYSAATPKTNQFQERVTSIHITGLHGRARPVPAVLTMRALCSACALPAFYMQLGSALRR